MKSTLPLLLLASSAVALGAQTASHTAAHPAAHTGTTAHAALAGLVPCLTLPPLSPKIPALPAGTPCPRPLYTITRHADLTLDYKAPVIKDEHLEDAFGTRPITLTLGFVDVVSGTGDMVKPGLAVSLKYTGYLVDGTKFDSSDDHPGKEPLTITYGEHRVIAGWDTGLEGMRAGGKRRLFIPYQLAYGEKGGNGIPPKAMLIFDLELVSVKPVEPPAPPTPPQPVPPAGAAAPATNPSTPATSTAPATKPEAK